MINGKVWGVTEVVLATPTVEVHRLTIKPNAFCSWHEHTRTYNAFVVLSGELDIEVRKGDYDLTDVTKLGPTEVTTVKPGEYHRFVSGEKPVVALEIYYLDGLVPDIIREDVGGLKSDHVQAEERIRSPVSGRVCNARMGDAHAGSVYPQTGN